MQKRLAEVMDFLEEKRRDLLRSFDGAHADRLGRRPAPDRWSVAQVLDHLRTVESGIARLITKRVTQAKATGLGTEKSTESAMPTFDKYRDLIENQGTMQSPSRVMPRADVDINEAISGLETSRADLRAAVSAADGLSLGEIKHTHPILGELDLYQWLIFVGSHEVRHRKQIERTLKSIPE
ncbi:MAG: DinB family protein [Gemmatimonadaceae bacterium]